MPGLGFKSVTIMMRTGLFPHAYSRYKKSKTNTLAFSASVRNSFDAFVQGDGLRLPTFDEVLAEHKARTGCNSDEILAELKTRTGSNSTEATAGCNST